MLITSYTQAKRKTQNLPFGLGKTTLAMWLLYYLFGGQADGNSENIWIRVKEAMVYNPYALAQLLKPGTVRHIGVIWDDVQATAPSSNSVPEFIRHLANFISTERPEIACLIMTAPNIGSISAPLRKLVNFEIIVSERGQYEVHKITHHKKFNDPFHDYCHLDYIEELNPDTPFRPLRPQQQLEYDKWRIEQKLKLYPQLLSSGEAYLKLKEFAQANQPTIDEHDIKALLTIQGTIIKVGGGYAYRVPDAVGRELHHKGKITAQIIPPT